MAAKKEYGYGTSGTDNDDLEMTNTGDTPRGQSTFGLKKTQTAEQRDLARHDRGSSANMDRSMRAKKKGRVLRPE